MDKSTPTTTFETNCYGYGTISGVTAMIFGTCVSKPMMYYGITEPSIRKYCGYVDLLPWASNGKVSEVYENIRRIVSREDFRAALVLLHDDVEILGEVMTPILQALAEDPDVAIVGCVGAKNVRSLRWWEGDIRGHAEDARPGITDGGFEGGDVCEVDSVDGMFFALSPWAVNTLGFRPDLYPGVHGAVEEVCFQARKAGKKVVVAKLPIFHHSHGGYAGGKAGFDATDETFRARWHLNS